MDTHNIKAGDPISQKIATAIRQSHGMIVIFSENYVNSEWCKKEILQAASSGHKKLYPIRRQNIRYCDLLDFHLGDLRWVDVLNDDQYADGLQTLIEALEEVHSVFQY